MKRFYPFLFASVATLLAVGLSLALTLALTRSFRFELGGREIAWRRILGRVVDEAAETLETEAAA